MATAAYPNPHYELKISGRVAKFEGSNTIVCYNSNETMRIDCGPYDFIELGNGEKISITECMVRFIYSNGSYVDYPIKGEIDPKQSSSVSSWPLFYCALPCFVEPDEIEVGIYHQGAALATTTAKLKVVRSVLNNSGNSALKSWEGHTFYVDVFLRDSAQLNLAAAANGEYGASWHEFDATNYCQFSNSYVELVNWLQKGEFIEGAFLFRVAGEQFVMLYRFTAMIWDGEQVTFVPDTRILSSPYIGDTKLILDSQNHLYYCTYQSNQLGGHNGKYKS